MKRITSIDVAKLANVSQSTVSRVFSPNAKVSAAKRERVLLAAQQLGYKPNLLARSLITQSTNLIGVVVADISKLFYANLLGELTVQLRQIGKQVILFNVGVTQTADEVLSTLLAYRVDALIIAATTLSADMAADCARSGTPVILFNRSAPLAQVSCVCVDNERGGREVANLFKREGHERVAYISGISSTQTNQLREKGFMERWADIGVGSVLYEQGDYSYEAGIASAERLLMREDRPSAIFCANDQMAFGVIDVARRLGLSIPEELSIVGFDNVPQAAWDPYQLTTVAQPLDLLIDATMNVLEARLSGEEGFEPKIELIEGELIERNTTSKS